MDLRKLKKLIDLVQESGIAELEITEGEEKVRISRIGHGPADGAWPCPPGRLPMPALRPRAATAAAAAGPAARLPTRSRATS